MVELAHGTGSCDCGRRHPGSNRPSGAERGPHDAGRVARASRAARGARAGGIKPMAWLKPHAQREYPQEHVLAPVITLERRTLAQRMGESKLSAGEALRLAIELAQAMRTLHDAGRAHGILNPSSIELTPSGIELAASRGARGVPTPYSAPEILKGQPAD